MIIHHANNVAAFKGNHVFYTLGAGYSSNRLSVTSAAPAPSAGQVGTLMMMGVGLSYFGVTIILKMLMELGYGF